MKLFTTVVRRIQEAASSASGFIASVINVAVQLSNRFTLIAGTASPAVAIDITRQEFRGPTQVPAFDIDLQGVTGTAASPPHTPAFDIDASLRDVAATGTPQNPAFAFAQREESSWTTPQTPAIDIDLQGVTGTAANQVHTPAVDVDASLRDAAAANAPQNPACTITQVTYTLTRRAGGNAQAAVGTAWTNPPNAIDNSGIHNAVFATCAGSMGGNTNGIALDFLNHVGKDELTITSATLFVYMKATDTGDLLLSTAIKYNIGAGLVTLETILGGFTSDVTPRSYSLPLLDTWTEYNALQAQVICTFAALSALANASLDAIEIEIVATLTEDPNPP